MSSPAFLDSQTSCMCGKPSTLGAQDLCTTPLKDGASAACDILSDPPSDARLMPSSLPCQLKRDEQRPSRRDFVGLLNTLLLDALPPDQRRSPPRDLLQACLNAVVPVCTGDGDGDGAAGAATVADTWEFVRDSILELVTKVGDDADRYEDYAKAFNDALAELKNVQTPLTPWRDDGGEFRARRHDGRFILEYSSSLTASGCVSFVGPAPVAPVEVGPSNECICAAAQDRSVEPSARLKPDAVDTMMSIRSGSDNPAKRKLESESSERDKKRLKTGAVAHTLPVPGEGEARAADQRRDVPNAGRAIHLAVVDSVVWVCWCDKRNVHQSAGIDFSEDFPCFLALLLALQRSGLEERSVPLPPSAVHITLEDKGVAFTVAWSDAERLVRTLGPGGRGTCVVAVKSDSLDPRDPARLRSLEGQALVAKFCWPDNMEPSEPVILRRVQEIAKTNDKVRGHIPDLVAFRDFDEVDTRRIMQAFSIPPNLDQEGGQRLRVLLFPRLLPITALTGDHFWSAFMDCFVCHYELWRQGVHHRDISHGNLMYYMRNEKPIGVLIDFDLSSLSDFDAPHENEWTGTLPFVALDLLSWDALGGRVVHRYRHDAEAFTWVLAWICVQYHMGRDETTNETYTYWRPHKRLQKWETGDIDDCRNSKAGFLHRRYQDTEPSAAHKSNFERYKKTLLYQMKQRISISIAQLDGAACAEPLDSDVFKAYMRCFSDDPAVLDSQ